MDPGQTVTAWVLALMVALQPNAPWLATYPETARAIDAIAHAAPLYDGEDGVSRTAALLIATAWYEAKFDPAAVARDGSNARCLGQVDVRGLIVSETAIVEDVALCIGTMMRLMHESFRVCRLRGRPPLERLGQYTGGGGECDRGLDAARRRAGLADWLVRRWPVRWVEERN